MALPTLLQRLRPQAIDNTRQQRIYRAHVLDCASRVRAALASWEALREVESDASRLANAAAVNRWELMRLVRETAALQPPRSCTTLHRDLQLALTTAARACQLLANGYRSHKSEAVCDGQALLLENVQRLDELVQAAEFR